MAIDSTVLFISDFVVPGTFLVIVSLGLEMQWGQEGLFNAGVAAFIGVGAYVFGGLAGGFRPADLSYGYQGHWGLSVPMDLILAALIGMAASGLLGIAIAIPTVKLRADYLAIATLALAQVIGLIFLNAESATGGSQGLFPIPRPFTPRLVQPGWQSNGIFTLIAAVVLLIVLLVLEYITRSPWGRSLKSVREDEEAAEALGKNTFQLKLASFGIGCAIMGLAGAIQASWLQTISPEDYLPLVTFTAYVVVILGGAGNPRGVVLGGYAFYGLLWGFQVVKNYVPTSQQARVDFFFNMLVGVILVVIILFRPSGLLPERKFVPRRT